MSDNHKCLRISQPLYHPSPVNEGPRRSGEANVPKADGGTRKM
jgi:hypothetical protein